LLDSLLQEKPTLPTNSAGLHAVMGATDEQFCLRWNDFQQCIKSTFQDLRAENDFMDVTISCDGEQAKAHKVILSACSVTFKNLLKKNPAQHPVIVLWDVSPRDLSAILDFMYHGEVNVKQDHLNSFLAVAERLRVRGLCQNENSDPTAATRFTSNPEKSKPGRGSDAGPEPSAKRPRPSFPAPQPQSSTISAQDDDIEEIPAPVVTVKKEEVAGPARVPPHEEYQIAEAGYDDSGQGEYADYGYEEDEMGYAEGAMLEQSQGKGDNVCPECGKFFTAASSLKRHVRDYHSDSGEQFFCDLCDKAFRTKGLLINHKSQYHRWVAQ